MPFGVLSSFAASKQRRGDPDGAIYGIAGRLTIEMDKTVRSCELALGWQRFGRKEGR